MSARSVASAFRVALEASLPMVTDAIFASVLSGSAAQRLSGSANMRIGESANAQILALSLFRFLASSLPRFLASSLLRLPLVGDGLLGGLHGLGVGQVVVPQRFKVVVELVDQGDARGDVQAGDDVFGNVI